MSTAAPACRAALTEATRRWPGRSKASDGILGDQSHKARRSDHNEGNAFDLTSDPGKGVDCTVIAERLRWRAASGEEPRITYLIWNRQIASPKDGWRWRAYTGSNPHTKHLHVSIDPASRADTRDWFPPTQEDDDDMTPAQEKKVDDIRTRVDHANSEIRTIKQQLTDITALLKKSHPGTGNQ